MIQAIEILLKGIILGLTVSMPPGPVGIILINRTIKRGALSGFFSGLGLATADTVLAILAGIGFTFIASFIKEERIILTIVAGIIISGVGIKIFLSNPVKEFRAKTVGKKSLWRDFYSLFIVSVTNPYTILICVAFFSGINVSRSIEPGLVPFLLIPGVFLGAVAWWVFISYFISRVKKKIRLRSIVRINKIAGTIITIIGIFIILSLFAHFKF
jgi:threonine/homoserine/homoserine lactone efflux protein